MPNVGRIKMGGGGRDQIVFSDMYMYVLLVYYGF